MFGPPFGPPDFVRSASGLHDDPLISWTECVRKTSQRGLDKPRFEGHPRGLAVRIELLGHSQRLKRRCDASGAHNFPGNDADLWRSSALALPGFLDHSQGVTSRGIVAFECAFCELKEKGLGRRDTALGSAFADFHHLAKNGLMGRFATTPSRTTGRIAALALCKARRLRRVAISNAALLNILW